MDHANISHGDRQTAKVALVSAFNPKVATAGGIRPHVEALGRYLESVGVPSLTVASGNKLCTDENPVLVPVKRYGSTAFWLAGLLANVTSLPIPSDAIVHVHRPDDLVAFVLSGTGRTWVCTLHGNPLQAIRERGLSAVYAAYAAVEAWALRRAHRVIFVDPENASEYLERYQWLDGRYEIIPNAVDTDLFKPGDKDAAKKQWGFRGKVFLYAGRLQPEKRVLDIVQAFRGLDRPDALMVIAGEGREAPQVAAAARGLHVRLLGPVSRSGMPSLMNAVDALVMYSTREGLPSVVLEALACGVPVITTPVGALRDVVIDGETGIIVNSRANLESAMERLYRDHRADSSAIRRTVMRYSWSALGPKVLDTYSRAERAASGDPPHRRP